MTMIGHLLKQVLRLAGQGRIRALPEIGMSMTILICQDSVMMMQRRTPGGTWKIGLSTMLRSIQT